MTQYDVQIGDKFYPLVRDPAHVHPPELHAHLGTDTVRGDTGQTVEEVREMAIRRLLNAVDEDDWFDETGADVGRDPFGIGV